MVRRMSRSLIGRLLLLPAFVLACSAAADDDTDAGTSGSTGGDAEAEGTAAPTSSEPGTTGGGESSGTTGEGGHSWPDPEDAPGYDGEAFTGMKIYDVAAATWLDEMALMAGLEPAQVVFVGEQHEVAAIQELELWVLQRVLAGDPTVALGMEHFQRDEQPVIDDSLAGTIDAAAFEATSQPWDGYAGPDETTTLGPNIPTEASSSDGVTSGATDTTGETDTDGQASVDKDGCGCTSRARPRDGLLGLLALAVLRRRRSSRRVG